MGVAVADGTVVGVGVGIAVAVGVGIAVAVGAGIAVGVGVGIAVADGTVVGVGVAVGIAVAVGAGIAVAVGAGTAVAVGLGKTLISSAEEADSCSAVRVAMMAASIVDSNATAAVVVSSIDTATVASISGVICGVAVGIRAVEVQPTKIMTVSNTMQYVFIGANKVVSA